MALVLGLFLLSMQKPVFAAQTEQPIQTTMVGAGEPATMNFQFPFTNQFNLTVLPSNSATPLHYTVIAGNNLDQVSIILNNTDTYTILLAVNYSQPESGNLSYYIYSPYWPTDGDQINFTQTTQLTTRITVIAQLFTPPLDALQLFEKLAPFLNQTMSQGFAQENQQNSGYFNAIALGLFIAFISIAMIGMYLLYKLKAIEREREFWAEAHKKVNT